MPDVQDPSSQAREIKQALRDPVFARTVNNELRAQTLLAIIASLCFLFLFFFMGFLVTDQASLAAIATACILSVIPLGSQLSRDDSAQIIEVEDQIVSSSDT